MKRILTILLSAITLCTHAQNFDQYFEDKTLRLDYILAGDANEQHIYLEEMMQQSKWAGRRNRLAEKFLNGNGQLVVRDHETQEIIYIWTFSTLFQEWLQYDEAKKVKKAFEASYNVPFPKAPVDITITLTDNHGKVTTELTHSVDPKDILIRRIGDNGIPFHYVWKGNNTSTPKETEDVLNKTNNSSKPIKRNYVYTEYNPMEGVNIENCVDLAIVAEGYTEAQMGKFYNDCQRAIDALFAREPFKSLKNRFNVVAVAAPSQDAGPSVPHTGVWKRGTSGAHYDTFYSDRYLTTSAVHKLFDLLSGVPFEHIIVLINTSRYGGGGIYNQWMCSSSDHATFKQVLVHEFEHSYAGLADEYNYGDNHVEWYPADTEPWEPNITTLKDFNKKWKDLIAPGTPIPTTTNNNQQTSRPTNTQQGGTREDLNAKTKRVGVFEGAGYMARGAYRPAELCRMNVNEVEDFCPVCTRAIIQITDFYTGTVK